MRIPDFLCHGMLGALMDRVVTRPPDFVIGGTDNPYLLRWHVTPRGEGPACYLHQFRRSDDDRALHDHPYCSTSIILRGQYVEHLPAGQWFRRVTGDVVQRDATTPHRVELLRDADGVEVPCWTLFLTGPRLRDWGFHCPQGWVPWQVFTDARDAGATGRGCG